MALTRPDAKRRESDPCSSSSSRPLSLPWCRPCPQAGVQSTPLGQWPTPRRCQDFARAAPARVFYGNLLSAAGRLDFVAAREWRSAVASRLRLWLTLAERLGSILRPYARSKNCQRAALGVIACAVFLLRAFAPVEAEEVRWVRLSAVMSELSAEPAFVDRFLKRLGRDPDAGGILGPDEIKRLREAILGKHWEALDRFPGLTVAGLGRSVRLAALAQRHLADGTNARAPDAGAPGATAKGRDVVEPLGIPAGGAAPDPGGLLTPLGFELLWGDEVDPERMAHYADSLRLATVMNRLALNPAEGQPGPRYRVSTESGVADSPQTLLAILAQTGHDVAVRDARYFANFGDLIYKGRDVLTPFWMDTRIAVPGTERALLVPVGHSQHEIILRGPTVEADLSFYFGIDGKAEFRPIATRNQAWVLGRVARTYRDERALEVVRLAGEIVRTYDAVRRAHPDLPFGGYFALGVCNDVNAMIELHMQGETTLFPLTLDPGYFPGESEVERLARRLPVDRGGRPPEPSRVFGSLPVADLAELPLPGLRRDLEAVRTAWQRGELRDAGASGIMSWAPLLLAVLVVSALVVPAFISLQKRRGSVSAGSPLSRRRSSPPGHRGAD